MKANSCLKWAKTIVVIDHWKKQEENYGNELLSNKTEVNLKRNDLNHNKSKIYLKWEIINITYNKYLTNNVII